jgi:hypothetical protein
MRSSHHPQLSPLGPGRCFQRRHQPALSETGKSAEEELQDYPIGYLRGLLPKSGRTVTVCLLCIDRTNRWPLPNIRAPSAW